MKIIKYLAAASLTLLAVSCNKEQVAEIPDGQTVDVTFTAALPGEMATKALGDGQTAKTLYVSVYENDDAKTKLELDKTATFTDLKTQVTFSLVKGKTYNFVFWAQAAEGAPYDVTDLKNIKISYEGAEANDEKRDAFYATRKELKVNGALTETIKLYRPFAQVNFGTADYEAAVAAGVEPVKSVFTATDVATIFDTFEAEGKEAKDVVTFTESALPGETLVTKAGDYKWMTMNYILPMGKQDAKHISNVTAEFIPETGITVKASSPQTPVQNNYRTNILGNLLTSQVIFNIEIVPIFNEPDNDIDIVNIKNVESLKALFATGGSATLSEDLVVNEPISVATGAEVTLDLNGKTVTNTEDLWDEATEKYSIFEVAGGALTLKGDGTVKAKENDCYALLVSDGGHLIIEDGTYVGNIDALHVYEGLAEIKGGSYSIQQLCPLTGHGPYDFVLNCKNENYAAGKANIIVTGGSFQGFDPANAKSDDAASYLAPGYISVETNGVWTVVRGDKPVAMTAAELQAYITAFTVADSGDNVVKIGKDIVLKEGETWVPATIDGYHGAGVITVLGNGHTISGLNAPLFAGGFAGNSGIIVKDLTLDGVKINDAASG